MWNIQPLIQIIKIVQYFADGQLHRYQNDWNLCPTNLHICCGGLKQKKIRQSYKYSPDLFQFASKHFQFKYGISQSEIYIYLSISHSICVNLLVTIAFSPLLFLLKLYRQYSVHLCIIPVPTFPISLSQHIRESMFVHAVNSLTVEEPAPFTVQTLLLCGCLWNQLPYLFA